MKPLKQLEDLLTRAYYTLTNQNGEQGDTIREERLQRAEARGLASCATLMRRYGAKTPQDKVRAARRTFEARVAIARSTILQSHAEPAVSVDARKRSAQ